MPHRFSFTRLSVFQQPLLFTALSFICGLLFAAGGRISARNWMVLSAGAWIISSIALWMNRGNLTTGALLMIGFFAGGGALWSINEASIGENRVRRLFERGELKIDEPIEICGTLSASPELAPDRIYLSIAVEKTATLGRELAASGAVQIVAPFNDYESRFEYDSLALDYGTRVRLLGHLSNRRGYQNPGAPDFDELLEHRGYDATGWIKSPLLIERLGEGKRNPILSSLYRLRARALAVALRHFRQPTSGILAAALFGNRYFLSRDTAEAFRAGGTFHLLVISGLHVALIALIALRLVTYLSHSRPIQYALALALMWAYSLMVGAQPSITRAVVMLSIALIGRLIFRSSTGANTLAASAIALLAWQPRDIFNPAFQLSFLTVLMIVVFTGPLYARLKQVGEWRPTASTPYPPRVTKLTRWFAETLFWDEAEFRAEMKESRIRYRLKKSGAALWLNKMRLQKALTWIAVTIFTTTGVQLGLLPVMIMRFHRVSIVSPITNVIEGALLFALMVAGAIYLVAQPIGGGFALKLAGAVNALGTLTVKSCEPMLAWRGASLRVPDFGASSGLIIVGYFIAVLILVIIVNEWNPLRKGDEIEGVRNRGGRGERIEDEKKFLCFPRSPWFIFSHANLIIVGRTMAIISSLAILFLSVILIVHPFKHDYVRGRLSVAFLDVGQGDAILIGFPQGSLMMLDAGGRPGFNDRSKIEESEDAFIEDRIGIAEAAVMPYLWRRGISRLDWIIASHGDADHVEGFMEIARSFEIGAALKGSTSTIPYAFDKSEFPLREVKRGDVFEIDGSRLEVLSPFAQTDMSTLSDNNESIVLKITFGSRSFLLTGDIEKEAEARLAASGGDLRADVLKVAHHGSKTSSTLEFLEKVKPQHAVISVAFPSPFGHPHAEVIGRLREIGTQIWQTSLCGAITISTDGRDLRVETFVKCE